MFLTVFLFYLFFFIIMWVNQIVLKTRHGSLTIMVIWINLRTFYQSVTSSVFDQKKENAETWRIQLCAKRYHWQSCHLVGPYLFMRYGGLSENA